MKFGNKKGIELTLQTIVIFIILLVTFIVILLFFGDHFTSNSDDLINIGKNATSGSFS